MTAPLIRNAADEEQLTNARKSVVNTEKEIRRAYRKMLETAEGRLVLWDLLSFCGVFRSIWDGSSKIHYNAGKQDVGHYIQAHSTAAHPAALVEMMQQRLP